MLRHPAVADLFYPGGSATLATLFKSFPAPRKERIDATGLVVPHAGYRFSGTVAASVYAAANLPSTLILIGPNHRGAGSGTFPPRAALYGAGSWETPLGTVAVNEDLTGLLLDEASLLRVDPVAHLEEHALEVQLPLILHYATTPVTIVPIILATDEPRQLATLAEGIAHAVKRYSEKVVMIASTDFSHYVPQGRAERDDRMALDRIASLDPEGLLATVRERHISMCGAGPVAAVIGACKALGATKCEIVGYQTSGDVTGDRSSVVGYGGGVIH